MEWLFIVLLVLGIPLGLALWLIVRTAQSARRLDELTRRVGELEVGFHRWRRESASDFGPPATARPAVAPPTVPAPTPASSPVTPAAPVAPAVEAAVKPAIAPPPVAPVQPAAAAPPPIPPKLPSIPAMPAQPRLPSVNWEQFMGVKLFAWIGGLALFLGVAFFVKYSFEHNLIPPEVRVAIGFIIGVGLLAGGVALHRRKQYVIGAQALCATGVVILYAVTYACRSIYHFAFFGTIPTFLLMVLITATAFLVAVRLNALVVAILGMLGGFLTPILISTGVDNPFGLFGYIAVLDVGLLLVAQQRRWHFLTALAAVGTGLMQIGWADEFFVNEKYFVGNKILIAFAVLAGFNALYLAATWWSRRRTQINWWLAGGALGLAAVAFGFTGWFFTFETLAQRPWLMFGFLLLIDLMVTAVSLMETRAAPAQLISGAVVFLLAAGWTTRWLSADHLHAALAFYLAFAVLHAVFPMVRQRLTGVTGPLWTGQLFPPLALVLVLIPIFKLAEVSIVVWPFVLLVDLLAIGLAVLTASLLPVLAVLLLTLAATAALIFKIPATLTGLPTSFIVLAVFAVFFVFVSVWLVRKLRPGVLAQGLRWNENLSGPDTLAAMLPPFSATLPFLLLIMATLRLPLADPSSVFGLALLLVVLVLGVARLFAYDWLPVVGLVCVTGLECAWHFNRFDAAQPVRPLAWYLGFYLVFTVFPFLFLRKHGERVLSWATAALAGLPQFFLIHRLVRAAYPNEVMGLLPAAFTVPPLLGLVIVLRTIPGETKARLSQLAWLGGVALFFVTLIFPIQFERQWITLGWALEGVALLWLFHRVPHPGLRLTGVGLLAAAFVRLALNPAVLEYHPRSVTPILNWYLYSYGIVTVCLFVAARLLAPPRQEVFKVNLPPLLAGLGTVLAFLLLNIEIADYFSAPGSTLTFQFRGNFARDMTYSIAWALFALVLLVVGIVRNRRSSRYAALGLLSVTVLKLFFHDLAHLDQLYRIGAFIGVAVIAILASFAYQRFYAVSQQTPDKNETAS